MKHAVIGLKASAARSAQILVYAAFIIIIMLAVDKFATTPQVIQVRGVTVDVFGTVRYEGTVLEYNEPTAWTARIDRPDNGGVLCTGEGIVSWDAEDVSGALDSVEDIFRDQCAGYITENSTFTFTFIPLKDNYSPTVVRGLVQRPADIIPLSK